MDVNCVALVGRLASAPRLVEVAGGRQKAALRLAVERRANAKGEARGVAFVDVEAWNATAAACGIHLDQGRRVAVQGRLEHAEWHDADGAARQRVYVLADAVQFL